jgi:aerobic carbon-monoxide dehydrogenase medium subunit
MKPAAFKYVEVANETELAAALAESGDEARVLAGGQSLVPMINFRIVSPTVLIDINRVGTLTYIGRP